MRRDILQYREHGSLQHTILLVGIARELRRSGDPKWKAVHTTYQLPTVNGTPGPELDILAHRVDRKVDGARRRAEAVTVGIEVEEKYARQTILDKWSKYSYLVDRIYFVYVHPPRCNTRPPLENIKILWPWSRSKHIEDKIRDYAEQVI